jgi:hypothetical protein
MKQLRIAIAPLEMYVTQAISEFIVSVGNARSDQFKWTVRNKEIEIIGTVGKCDYAPLSIVIDNLRQVGGGN